MKNNTSDDSHHLHDKTAKMVLNNKAAFVELVTKFLPHLARKMDIEALTLDTTNYLGSNFNEQFFDVAYRTTYKGDAERLFSLMVLADHKREIGRSAMVQFLCYIGEVLKTDITAKRPLTTVVVVVLDQGKAKKRRKKQLLDFFDDLPEELKKYIPNFEVEFITIQGLSDAEILHLDRDGVLRGLFLMFKHLGDDNFLRKNFAEFFTFVSENEHLYEFAKLF